MADQDTTKTYVRDTRTTESSGTSMALIVGGLVVAVFFILWLVFGGDGPVVTTTPEGDTTNVTIEEPAAPADSTTNVTIDPAPEAAAPDATTPDATTPDAAAPADGAEPAPPADGTAPAAPPANP
jgi:hypothetical protein